ncbi:hypothetical protein VTI74DRAFT_2247 [Chaetomium olivicolor]
MFWAIMVIVTYYSTVRTLPTAPMPTLLEVLQRKNPDIIDHWASNSYRNTSSARFDEVTLDDGCRSHPYGDILDQQLPAGKEVQTPSDTPRTIIDENGIDTLGIAWSCNIERAPLKAAAPILRSRSGMATSTLASTPNPTLASKLISWRHSTDSGSSVKPDWAVLDHNLTKKYQHAHREDPAEHLVYAVGDSKLKQKWKSVWLSLPDSACTTIDIRKERMLPVRQLATYCRYGETRYAYLITQTELVALRVRRIASSTHTHSAAIEYRAIPWSANGPNQLTAHLAIWALGCMGMNDGHRAMEGPNKTVLSDMAKLTWWTEDKARGTFTNVISKRVLTAAQWAKRPTGTTVHTDNASGRSLTSTFTQAPRLPDLTQKLANLNLNAGKKQKPPSHTKCTIGKTKYQVTKDAKGRYVVLDPKTKKVKYTIVQQATKWVVSEDSELVVKME